MSSISGKLLFVSIFTLLQNYMKTAEFKRHNGVTGKADAAYKG